MKRNLLRRIFLLLLFLCLGCFKSFSIQVDSMVVEKFPFSESLWEKTVKDIDYSKEKKFTTPKQDFKGFKSPISAGTAKIILFTIVIALLLFILFRVFAGNIFFINKKLKEETEFSETNPEEDIHESDLEKLYTKAIERSDFRQAIRIYYLMVLKELSLKELIRWKKDKTNNEYIFEMMNNAAHERFREITILFERVWYGEADMNEKMFQYVSLRFNSFITELKNSQETHN